MVECLVLVLLGGLVLTLPLVSSPLLMGLWVLAVAMGLSLWIGLNVMSWFGLILFLVYIGGMLVMFIYFVAITPNQRHENSVFYALMGVILILFISLMKLILGMEFGKCVSFGSELMMFTNSQGVILILIFFLLFISLIIVVKVTQRVCGPFRPFMTN
uniref:NADH dehydrogenase subunit 6 n=2 Tax=Auchenoplax crinita TaxID=397536 RepID=G8XXL2_AUCCR|nr:NADH dehydrogenase subunit 6 [Auchenoplax crinita]